MAKPKMPRERDNGDQQDEAGHAAAVSDKFHPA
jgi:hypothetical protein